MQHAAEAGAKLVGVKYADIQTPILTSEQAVAAGSLFPETKAVQMQGDANKALAEAPVVIEGETSIGHQYHFHLETQRTICVPQEDGGLHVYSSTQNPTQVQAVVATALNKPQNKVKVGGGVPGLWSISNESCSAGMGTEYASHMCESVALFFPHPFRCYAKKQRSREADMRDASTR